MAAWTSDELNKIGGAEELKISPAQSDGTLRSPTTIWVVRIGDDLYVRSWNGSSGLWFNAAQESHEGYIRAGGVKKDVSFEEVSSLDLNAQVDGAYRAKYGQYSQYVTPMVTGDTRSTTLRLVPQTAGA